MGTIILCSNVRVPVFFPPVPLIPDKGSQSSREAATKTIDESRIKII